MQNAAIREWSINHLLKEKDIEVQYSGYVQCFCDDKAEEGNQSKQGYGKDDLQICQEYMETKLPMLLAAGSVTGIIVVLNIIIRNVTINLITMICVFLCPRLLIIYLHMSLVIIRL